MFENCLWYDVVMDIRQCEYCGQDYKPRKKRNKYCGNDCYVAHRESKKITTPCLECGTEFKSPKHENRKFCGSSCAATFNNRITPKRGPEGECKECKAEIPKRWTYCTDCRIAGRNQSKSCYICGVEFESNNSQSRYCSVECRVTESNNRKRKTYTEQREKVNREICVCGGKKGNQAQFCQSCRLRMIKEDRISEWLSGEWSGGSEAGLSKTIRAYLLEQSNYECSKCKFNTPHPDDNKTILEINHINGDGTDHSKENLEVVCPNCHALTSNYRARNMGKGRPHYYLRVSKA